MDNETPDVMYKIGDNRVMVSNDLSDGDDIFNLEFFDENGNMTKESVFCLTGRLNVSEQVIGHE